MCYFNRQLPPRVTVMLIGVAVCLVHDEMFKQFVQVHVLAIAIIVFNVEKIASSTRRETFDRAHEGLRRPVRKQFSDATTDESLVRMLRFRIDLVRIRVINGYSLVEAGTMIAGLQPEQGRKLLVGMETRIIQWNGVVRSGRDAEHVRHVDGRTHEAVPKRLFWHPQLLDLLLAIRFAFSVVAGEESCRTCRIEFGAKCMLLLRLSEISTPLSLESPLVDRRG